MNEEQSQHRAVKIAVACLVATDLAIAVAAPLASGAGHPFLAEQLLEMLYCLLIPLTGISFVLTFFYNQEARRFVKETAIQRLEVERAFWGRIALIGFSAVIMFVYVLFADFGIAGFIAMVVMYAVAIIVVPIFGKLITK